LLRGFMIPGAFSLAPKIMKKKVLSS